MSMLRKDAALFERDEKEEVIPIKATLDTKRKEEIVMTPMPRGAVRKAFADAALNAGDTTKDQDKEIILNYCVDPKFTSEEIDNMKYYMVNALASTILRESGVSEPDLKKGGDDDLKKS